MTATPAPKTSWPHLSPLRLGTRESRLALIQAATVRTFLRERMPLQPVRFVGMTTIGDRRLDVDLSKDAPDDFFTRDLDDALRGDYIDFAQHSAKDMPEQTPAGIAAHLLPIREDPRDCVVTADHRAMADLPAGARIGVSSPRREAWLVAKHPHLTAVPMRGTVPARVAQVRRGEVDGAILAVAGLVRLGLSREITAIIPADELEPHPLQGVLGFTLKADDPRRAWYEARLLPEVPPEWSAMPAFPEDDPYRVVAETLRQPLRERVWLTADIETNARLAGQLTPFGLSCEPVPGLTYEARGDSAAIAAEVERAERLIFTSPRGVEMLVHHLHAAGASLEKLAPAWVVGPDTALALAGVGYLPAAALPGRFSAAGIQEQLRDVALNGTKVFVGRSDRAPGSLPAWLRERGADVADPAIFSTVTQPLPAQPLRPEPGDILVFLSPSAVSVWAEVPLDAGVRIAVIGPTTADAVRKTFGREPFVEAANHSMLGVAGSIVDAVRPRESE